MKEYLIVSKKILPEYFDKVIEARQLLESNQCHSVSEAVKKTGISRSTYYKYKDYIFSTSENVGRKFILSISVADQQGVLARILEVLRERNTNVVTIHQDIPIRHTAYISITLDGSKMDEPIEKLLKALKRIDGVHEVNLVAME